MTKTELTLTQAEIDERVAILKRLRFLLEQQRDKFKEYLLVLEKQETSIVSENTEVIVAQAELEQQIVSNIMSLQKVIEPMEILYKNTHPEHAEQLPEIKTDLTKLQQKVLTQNEKNRALLKTHMASIKTKISQLKNPYAQTRSIYANSASTAGVIDISQ